MTPGITHLHIQNLLTIESLELSFGAGFTALTGETGAGKSILLLALGLALGQRASGKIMRPGAKSTAISATFSLDAEARAYLAERDLQGEMPAEVICRRVLRPEGSKAYINDQPVSLETLSGLGEMLVEIHGQHDKLLNPKTHLQIVDTYGGLQEEIEAIAEAFATLKVSRQAVQNQEEALNRAEEEKLYILRAAEELDALAPQEGEAEALEKRREFLKSKGKTLQICQSLEHLLEGEQGAFQQLSEIYQVLSDLRAYDPDRGEALLNLQDQAEVSLKELQAEVQGLQEEMRAEGAMDLEEIEDRLYALKAGAKKFGVMLDALPQLWDNFRERKKQVNHGPEALAEAKKALAQAEDRYRALAENLSRKRLETCRQLEQEVLQACAGLKLEGAQVLFQHEALAPAQWQERGLDRLEIHVSFNAGMAPGPLAKVASGGERSRLMLALRQVMARATQTPTLIFDEIDLGVGGAVADAMGKKLKALSQDLQVFSITHAPQVAALCDMHLKVSKTQGAETTASRVQVLEPEERLEEVARMLAGDQVTPEAREAAASLMGQVSALRLVS